MADLRLQTGSPEVVMVDGHIHRVDGPKVWWVDQGGRVMGPARMAWQPPSMSNGTGGQPHHHELARPPAGTACVVIIPSGDWGRAVVIPLGGGGL